MSATIIVPGNIGNEVETFQFGQSGEGLKFDVCVSDTGRDGTETKRWYKIACFGRIKDNAKALHEEGRLTQGAKVLVIGTFNPRDYTTRNGETKTSFDVTATSVEVLHPAKRQQPTVEDQYSEGFEYADDDDQPNF